MNPAAPDGAPAADQCCKHICKHRTAPPCLGEALRRGALKKLQGVMIFIVRLRTPVHAPISTGQKNSFYPQYLMLNLKISKILFKEFYKILYEIRLWLRRIEK